MARKIPLSPVEQISEINLTPLMDLTFILLITFIITFPLMEQGIPLELPDGKGESVEMEDDPTLISVDAEGKLYLGYDKTPTTENDLTGHLAVVSGAKPDTVVIVRGDESTKHGRVLDVMMMVREAGLTKVSMAIREGGS